MQSLPLVFSSSFKHNLQDPAVGFIAGLNIGMQSKGRAEGISFSQNWRGTSVQFSVGRVVLLLDWPVCLSLPFSACCGWRDLCWPQCWIKNGRLNGRAKSILSPGHQVCTDDPVCHGLNGVQQGFRMVSCPPSTDLLVSLEDSIVGVRAGTQWAGKYKADVSLSETLLRVAIWITSSYSDFTVNVKSK